MRQIAYQTVANSVINQTPSNFPFGKFLFQCGETSGNTITDIMRGFQYTTNTTCLYDAVNSPGYVGFRTTNTQDGFVGTQAYGDTVTPGSLDFMLCGLIATTFPGNAGYIRTGIVPPSGQTTADDSIAINTSTSSQTVLANAPSILTLTHTMPSSACFHAVVGRWIAAADLHIEYYLDGNLAATGVMQAASQPIFTSSFLIKPVTATMYVGGIGYAEFQNGTPIDIRDALRTMTPMWKSSPSNRVWYPGWVNKNL